ncbi:MAG: stage III sporulation protein AF [Peptococcaceae bacterium]|jgi:stage III sporulation protein AF|nr:stage III sporulation protein AF [Peptococcaceae bacterium]
METLRALVRHLVIILLLAVFVEMLLPNEAMRRFVRLLMGLFVISALLQPITALLHTPLTMDIPAWADFAAADFPVWADENPDQMANSAVVEQYRLILENQIRSLALGVKGVREAEVTVLFTGERGTLWEQPEIDVIRVALTVGEQAAVEQSAEMEQSEEVKAKIRALLEIPEDKLQIRQK